MKACDGTILCECVSCVDYWKKFKEALIPPKRVVPPCYNRPPVHATLEVQDGWTPDGRRNMITIPNVFEDRCATHDGDGIGPKGENYPQAHGWVCDGCRWFPHGKY